jgi:hypothetical protein
MRLQASVPAGQVIAKNNERKSYYLVNLMPATGRTEKLAPLLFILGGESRKQ